jgi:hypothetical protein
MLRRIARNCSVRGSASICPPAAKRLARAACTAWGGRIPIETELINFVQAAMPCLAHVTFPITELGKAIWSSTPDPQNSSFYYCVFWDGTSPTPAPESDGHFAPCVK